MAAYAGNEAIAARRASASGLCSLAPSPDAPPPAPAVVRRVDAFDRAAGAAVLACEGTPGSAGPCSARLQLRSMRRGLEIVALGARRLHLDEDAYLILNAGSGATSRYAGDGPAPLAVAFDAARLAEALATPAEALEGGVAPAGAPVFLEHLRPRGDAVGRVLRQLERALRGADADALDELLARLLDAALASERALRGRRERIDSVKPATRAELLRRVLLASDFMLGHYDQPLRLQDIADAARLSRFHLVRLFRQTHGVTPREYLLAKRLTVAGRLLRETRCDLSEIALRCGFGTRCSLFRHLQRQLGAGGRGLRGAAPEAAGPPAAGSLACLTAA